MFIYHIVTVFLQKRYRIKEYWKEFFVESRNVDSYKNMLFQGIVVHLRLFLPEDEIWIDLIALISRSLMRS